MMITFSPASSSTIPPLRFLHPSTFPMLLVLLEGRFPLGSLVLGSRTTLTGLATPCLRLLPLLILHPSGKSMPKMRSSFNLFPGRPHQSLWKVKVIEEWVWGFPTEFLIPLQQMLTLRLVTYLAPIIGTLLTRDMIYNRLLGGLSRFFHSLCCC